MPDQSANRRGAESPRYLLIGEVLRPHGIRGEIRMRVLTDFPERISERDTVFINRTLDNPEPTAYTLERARPNQEYMLLKLEGVNDRDQAERLRDSLVMIAIEDAVPLEEGEYFLFQLHGLEVRTEDGQPFGVIKEVLETGANDVYVVNSLQHGEVLIPAIPESVLEVNIDGGYVLVHLMDGLLPGT
ncbi:MAG: 16S rRNA processing protein RimM [Anaerolineaceae bacterium]|nr:16S rRNA processing protein RimM [Anaerolineaceae bacterium]